MNVSKIAFVTLVVFCLGLVTLEYPVVGEVTKLTINTDSSWKCLDFEQQGWTSTNYNDSWWEYVKTGSSNEIEKSWDIWYPTDIVPKTVYFRKSFEIDGSNILIGELYTGLYASGGNIELYLNDQHVGDATSQYTTPQKYDVTSLLKPGTNVIAAKVSIGSNWGWALSGTIRYSKS